MQKRKFKIIKLYLSNGCPACELLLKSNKKANKCKTCGHYYETKKCELDHDLIKELKIRRKKK